MAGPQKPTSGLLIARVPGPHCYREFLFHSYLLLASYLHFDAYPVSSIVFIVPPALSPPVMPSLEDPKQNEARLLLVSNRLPITIKRSEDGKYDFSMSSGGLVSGLSGLSKSTTFQWYGWPGLEVPEAEIPVVKQRLKEEYGAVPVFIDDELADRHYNGFSSELFLLLPSFVA